MDSTLTAKGGKCWIAIMCCLNGWAMVLSVWDDGFVYRECVLLQVDDVMLVLYCVRFEVVLVMIEVGCDLFWVAMIMCV